MKNAKDEQLNQFRVDDAEYVSAVIFMLIEVFLVVNFKNNLADYICLLAAYNIYKICNCCKFIF